MSERTKEIPTYYEVTIYWQHKKPEIVKSLDRGHVSSVRAGAIARGIAASGIRES